MHAPAFTSVATRGTFGGPNPVFVPSSTTITNPAPVRQQPSIEWPASVRDYVQRTFAEDNKLASIANAELQVKLKEVINKAVASGQLHSTDWSTQLLPQQLIMADRDRPSLPPITFPSPPSPTPPIANPFKPSSESDSSKKRKLAATNFGSTRETNLTHPVSQKSSTMNVPDTTANQGPPTKSKKMDKLEKRKQKFYEQTGAVSKSNGKLEERRNRFSLSGPVPYRPQTPVSDSTKAMINQGPIVGTCEDIFKDYYRLTAPPDPRNVRPLRVLRQTLEALILKWKAENNYNYICGQFKSLRQDITVQRVSNEFTVRVYEVHARIALEKADVGEYNQCQTQLRALYKQRLGGHPGEFLAYRILYFLYTCNRTDMSDLLANITPADRQDLAVQHALQTRSALALGNYHRFFKLYMDTPNLGAYLMDMFIVRERLDALARITKSYKQSVPLRFLSEELAFESDEQCAGFILDHGGEPALEQSDDGVRFVTAKAGATFEAAKTAAFAGVDIKGQI